MAIFDVRKKPIPLLVNPVRMAPGDRVGEGKTGPGCGEALSYPGPDAPPVEENQLHELGSEQRQRKYREQRITGGDALGEKDHGECPRQRAQVEDQVETIRKPRQSACDEVLALATGELRWREPEKLPEMAAEDQHGAIGPPEPLFAEVQEGIGYEPASVGAGDRGGLVAVFGDA